VSRNHAKKASKLIMKGNPKGRNLGKMQKRIILNEEKKRGRVTNGDRSIDPLNVALFDEDFHGFEAQSLHFRLLQRLTPLQLLYLLVQV